MSQWNTLDLVAHPEFYERIENYQPKEEDYLKSVKKLLPKSWNIVRNGLWFGCHPPIEEATESLREGWKIHVSSNVLNAEDILKAVVPLLTKCKISFKFSVDKMILSMMNGKGFARQGAGKFITIYPFNDEHFKWLIEEIHQVTKDFQGLYILSDKRYKDSKVVFYRYGGIKPVSFLDFTGHRVSMLMSPDGEKIPDTRKPYFFVPAWAKDPLQEPVEKSGEQPAGNEITLKDGRYVVKYPLNFSNSGGVYVAEDRTTGIEVVIKEARPFTSTTENSTALLEKENRILSKVAHTGLVPKPLDYFQDWEHSFLVLEKLSGTSLATFMAGNNLTHLTHPTINNTRKSFKTFKTIFLQLAHIIKAMHDHNIVIGDLSPNNVMVDHNTLKIKMLDFEGAYEVNNDAPVKLFTNGFAPPDQMSGVAHTFASDCFAFGATMHYYLTPVNQIFPIYPKARFIFANAAIKDIGFPKSIGKLIDRLLDKVPENRPTPAEVIEILEDKKRISSPKNEIDKESVREKYQTIVDEIPKYIIAKADYSRNDRLFPADGKVFGTNPLSISHGACGVAYGLKKMNCKVPKKVINWILKRNKHPELYPPGLFVGLSGIAWIMLELGLEEEAQKVLDSTFEHPLLNDVSDIYYGLAGWGMTNLKFYTELKEMKYLEKSLEAADSILKTSIENEKGLSWNSPYGVQLGYGHGSSGISLFLLYLYLATGEKDFLQSGIKALDFDINNASPNLEDGLSWRRIVDQGKIIYPYLRYGSAGVGLCLIRYYRLLGDERYKDILEKIFIDTNRKYTVFPGYSIGLAGLGEFLLDLYQLTQEERHLESAYKVASGVALFSIQRDEGIAFPGEGLKRISCDFATGSAGIGHFFHRLLNQNEGCFNLDYLFDVSKQEKNSSIQEPKQNARKRTLAAV